MGLFGRKTVYDEIKKLFIEKNTSIEGENPITFQLNLDKYSLFPYITLNDNKDYSNISFMINLRKANNDNNQLFNNINSFNINNGYIVNSIRNINNRNIKRS